jgi:hypothetical protein
MQGRNEGFMSKRLWSRLIGEWLAIKWCLDVCQSVIAELWRASAGLLQTWAVIRPFVRCDPCNKWAQHQEYEYRGGLCDECWTAKLIAASPRCSEALDGDVEF